MNSSSNTPIADDLPDDEVGVGLTTLEVEAFQDSATRPAWAESSRVDALEGVEAVTMGRRPQEAVPPGYPREYESTARLDDGRRVKIRPILPSDAPELARAITTADAATLHSRFLGAPPRPTKAVLEALSRIDYTNQFALVALDDGRGIGIARYAVLPLTSDGSITADVAVAVAPDWRRAGLATILLQLLAQGPEPAASPTSARCTWPRTVQWPSWPLAVTRASRSRRELVNWTPTWLTVGRALSAHKSRSSTKNCLQRRRLRAVA